MSDSSQTKALCFMDTNVWLYAFIESQDKDKSAVAKSTIQSNEVIVSTQIINEVCVNLIKKAGFNEADIRSTIDSFYAKYFVATITREVLLKASELREQHHFSFWDSLIVACALLEGAEIVYSEDMDTSLTVNNRLKIVNPFA